MNILIPHSWLKDYLQTSASPQKIGECLSLCSCSVEKITKSGNDWIYHIEITTNRIDMMSVIGVAREAAAVLPQFGIKAKFVNDPYREMSNVKCQMSNASKILKVKILDQRLCPRFSAVILKNVQIKSSPKIVQDRLKKSGIRPINCIVDISNYLMRALGQPVHTFDYDKIADHKMILRASRKGEQITTLDKKTFKLPGGDIVIEDGSDRLIDLCGIMGGLNSAVANETKNVLLFIQTYRPENIRATSMALAQRTDAAQIFEKSPDPQMVMPAMLEGIKLAGKTASAKPDKQILDIYPNPYKEKAIKVSLNLINQRLGIVLNYQEINKILDSLGFSSKFIIHNSCFMIQVPSWRSHDISIPEDIVEEVARIYGYYRLPSIIPPLLEQPKKFPINFDVEQKIKNLLKDWGLTEVYTYSMVSKSLIEKFNLNPENHLKIKNPLTKDWVYMRQVLIPSLMPVIEENRSLKKKLKIFEIANVYLPKKNSLPEEKPYLVIVYKGSDFFTLKGLVEALLSELSIKFEFRKYQCLWDEGWFVENKSLDVFSGEQRLGCIGQLKQNFASNFNINDKVFVIDLEMNKLANFANDKKSYLPIPKYPPIIEDLTFEFIKPIYYSEVVTLIKKTSPLP